MISKPLVESFSDDAPKFLAGREPVASESARERDGFGGNFDEAPCIADWSELLLASLCLAGWFMLFCGGTLIGTAPYVAALSASKDWLATVGSGVIVMLFWTISNIGILCMLSAVLGAFGARTRFASKTAPLPSVSAALLTPKAQPHRRPIHNTLRLACEALVCSS